MANRAHRLDRIESSLTPTEAVVKWMDEAHEHGSLREFALSIVRQPDTKAPLYRLREFVIPGLEQRLKGKPPDEKNRRIHQALKDIAFLYYLQLEVNTRVTAETRAWLLTAVLISKAWLNSGSSPGETDQGIDDEGSWRSSAQRFIHELYVYDRAAYVVGDAYFNGRPVLFPDAAETLQDLIGRIETLIEMDHQDVKTGNGKCRARTRIIDLYKIKELAQEDAKHLVGEIVVMAKAEALEICGENQDSALLVKNYLEAGLGGAA